MNRTLDRAQTHAQTQDVGEIWRAALAILKEEVPEPSYRTWLQNARLIKVECGAQGREKRRGQIEAVAGVSVPSAFAAQWLQGRYARVIADALGTCLGYPVRVSFRIDHVRSHRAVRALDGMPPPAPAGPFPQPRPSVYQDTNTHPSGTPSALNAGRISAPDVYRSPLPALNPRYTFERFLVGRSNQLGTLAARRVAEAPGIAYNPLYIYGFHGVGKTHLLHAIGNDAYSRLGSRVLCAPAALFENHAVASRLVGTGAINHIDLLLIDDLHNISSGRGRTAQGWLAKLVEGMLAAGKGVVVTAAHPPGAMLALHDGLRSSLSEGTVIAIELPDAEMRLRMVRDLAQQSGKAIEQGALQLLASRGATMAQLRSLWEALMAARLPDAPLPKGDEGGEGGRPVRIQDAQAVLAKSGPPTMLRSRVGPERIINQVAAYFDLEPSEMCSSSRERRVMLPRQIAMYLIREQTDCSYEWIAHRFARRDHTTAMHSCGRVQELSETDLEVRRVLLELRQMVFGEHEHARSLDLAG